MKIWTIFYFLLCLSVVSCTQNNIKKSNDINQETNKDTLIKTNSTTDEVNTGFSSPFDTTYNLSDYNSDGYTDTLAFHLSAGSGSSTRYCTLIDGKTKDQYKLSAGGCFCQIKTTVIIPPALRTAENKPFLNAIAKAILPERMNKPDPSLQWIIHGTLNKYDPPNSKFFNRIIPSPINWIKGSIALPEVYYIKIGGDTLAAFYNEEEFQPDWYDHKDHNEGCLLYYGHNHYRNPSKDSLTRIARSPGLEVFRTSHGIVLKRQNSYAWIFVSDFNLTGAPQKLRWESIGKVQIIDHYIILQQELPLFSKSQIFIINSKNGTCGRMKFRPDEKTEYSAVRGNIHFKTDGQNNSFALSEIFRELE